MHQLIASYLFQHKSCPLPGIGKLSITEMPAVADFGNKVILAPVPVIRFEPGEAQPEALLNYVAARTHSNTYEASAALSAFFEKLKTETRQEAGADFEGIGNFVVDGNGDIQFSQQAPPAIFLQTVEAERVIHPQAEHSILVGDKETTNTVMTDYFNEEPVVKDRWWIWAIVLGLAALAILLFYFNDADASSFFGNAVKF